MDTTIRCEARVREQQRQGHRGETTASPETCLGGENAPSVVGPLQGSRNVQPGH